MTKRLAICLRLFVTFIVLVTVVVAHMKGWQVNYIVLIVGACVSFYFIGEERRRFKRLENY